MAKAFKWLLPGAVKQMTTKKNNKTKQKIRKETKKVQQRSDIQPFPFSLKLIHGTSRHDFAQLTGKSALPALPHISLVMTNVV